MKSIQDPFTIHKISVIILSSVISVECGRNKVLAPCTAQYQVCGPYADPCCAPTECTPAMVCDLMISYKNGLNPDGSSVRETLRHKTAQTKSPEPSGGDAKEEINPVMYFLIAAGVFLLITALVCVGCIFKKENEAEEKMNSVLNVEIRRTSTLPSTLSSTTTGTSSASSKTVTFEDEARQKRKAEERQKALEMQRELERKRQEIEEQKLFERQQRELYEKKEQEREQKALEEKMQYERNRQSIQNKIQEDKLRREAEKRKEYKNIKKNARQLQREEDEAMERQLELEHRLAMENQRIYDLEQEAEMQREMERQQLEELQLEMERKLREEMEEQRRLQEWEEKSRMASKLLVEREKEPVKPSPGPEEMDTASVEPSITNDDLGSAAASSMLHTDEILHMQKSTKERNAHYKYKNVYKDDPKD